MKKLILTGVMALGLGLMSFKSETTNKEELLKKEDCESYAARMANFCEDLMDVCDDELYNENYYIFLNDCYSE